MESRLVKASASQRSIDPLLPLVAVAGTLTYLLHGVNGYLSRDLAVYAYAGQQVADGVPPYLGILNRAGPLAHAIPGLGALAARVVGKDELLAMRLLFLVLSVAALCLVYVVGRAVFESRLAGLAAAACLLAFQGFAEYASYGPREKTPMVLFLLCAFWAATRRRWFLTGVFLGLATLVLQIALFAGLPAALAALAISPGGSRVAGLVRLAAGGLVTVVGTLAYYAVQGATTDLVEGFLLLNVRYTVARPVSTGLDGVWGNLEGGFGTSLWFLVAGMVALLTAGSAAAVPRWRARSPWLTRTVPLALGAAFGALWTVRDFDSWPDLFLLLPFGALGVGVLARAVQDVAPQRATIAVVVTWCLVAGGSAASYAVTERDDTLTTQRRSVDAVLRHLPEDSQFISFQAPHPLVLAGMTNPTRHQMFTTGLRKHIEDTWPGGLDGFIDDMLAEEAEMVAVGRLQKDVWAEALDGAYVRVGCAPGWIWYARASLGDATVDALRRAQRRVPVASSPHGCRGGG